MQKCFSWDFDVPIESPETEQEITALVRLVGEATKLRLIIMGNTELDKAIRVRLWGIVEGGEI